MSATRTRWAAVGAALAITLGAGGLGLVSATNPSDALTLVSITPCRLADTRPAPENVGERNTPLGEEEVLTVAAHGDEGNCTGIPATAQALSLNVTATEASLPTFLTLWPAGETQPDASSLNPTPGAPPTPNAVTAGVNDAGEFSIYNLQGEVNVIIDVNGYYVDHDHDDRYYTQSQVDQIVADATAAEAWTVNIPASSFENSDHTSNLPTLRYGTGVPRVEGMMTFHGADHRFWAGWTLPTSYTPGASVTVELHWLPENEIGPPPDPCNYAFATRAVRVNRPGARPFSADGTWPNGDPLADEFLVAHPQVDPANVTVQSVAIELDGSSLAPGDPMLMQLGRNGNSGDDKCITAMYFTGMTITES